MYSQGKHRNMSIASTATVVGSASDTGREINKTTYRMSNRGWKMKYVIFAVTNAGSRMAGALGCVCSAIRSIKNFSIMKFKFSFLSLYVLISCISLKSDSFNILLFYIPLSGCLPTSPHTV